MMSFETLIDNFLDDELTAEKHTELNDLLAVDQAARAEFLHRVALHRAIRAQLTSRQELDELAHSEIVPLAAAEKPVYWMAATWHTMNSAAALSMLISSIVMAILLLSLGLVSMRQGDHNRIGGTDSRFVARITNSEDVIWAHRNNQPVARAYLLPGRELELRSGLLEITFNDGAVVLIEGPTKFHANSRGSGTLEVGKLVAQVPREAIGFAILTPTAEIVDLGTEFGVRVAGDGTTDTTVMQGKIDVRLTAVAATDQKSVRLIAGQSVRIEPGDRTLALATTPSGIGFVRRLKVRPTLPPPALANVAAASNGGRVSSASPSFNNTAIPEKAIDEFEQQNLARAYQFAAGDGYHSTKLSSAHWEVEFARPQLLERIEIQGRVDYVNPANGPDEASRHRSLNIELYDADHNKIWDYIEVTGSTYDEATTKDDTPPSFGTIEFGTDGLDVEAAQRTAKYLRIVHTKEDYLALAEVRAFANRVDIPGTSDSKDPPRDRSTEGRQK